MDIKRDEAFEEAYAEICKPIIRRPYPRNQNGEYVYKEIHEAHLMWQQAQKSAVPKGFVLVSREMPKSFDEGLYVYSNSISIVGECSEGFIPMSDINHAEVWKLVIEAQEQMG